MCDIFYQDYNFWFGVISTILFVISEYLGTTQNTQYNSILQILLLILPRIKANFSEARFKPIDDGPTSSRPGTEIPHPFQV